MHARHVRPILRAGLLCAALASFQLSAQAAHPAVNADGTLTMPSYPVPYSSFASPEARKQFQIMLEQGRNAPGIASIEASRAYYDKINTDRAQRMEKLYPVKIHAQTSAACPPTWLNRRRASPRASSIAC
jgi:monoterpene epsilon-lactone hydrolase